MANGLEWVFVLLGGWTLLCQFENGNDFWKDAIALVRTGILERQHLSEFRSKTAILGHYPHENRPFMSAPEQRFCGQINSHADYPNSPLYF